MLHRKRIIQMAADGLDSVGRPATFDEWYSSYMKIYGDDSRIEDEDDFRFIVDRMLELGIVIIDAVFYSRRPSI